MLQFILYFKITLVHKDERNNKNMIVIFETRIYQTVSKNSTFLRIVLLTYWSILNSKAEVIISLQIWA